VKKKQIFSYIARFIVSFGLLYYFARNVQYHHLKDVFTWTSALYLFYAFLCISVNRHLTYIRIKMLLEVNGDKIPYGQLVKVGWMGDFGTFFMPGLIGSDMLRMFILNKYIRDANMAVSAVMYERFLGIVSLVCVVLVSLIWSEAVLHNTSLCYSIFGIGGFFIVCLFVFMRYPQTLLKISAAITKNRGVLGKKIHALAEALTNFATHKSVFMRVFALCFLIHAGRVIVNYFVALSIGIDVEIQYFFLFTPIIFFIMMLPISIGGFGVREASTIWLFSLVGVSAEDSFIMGLINSIIIVIYAFPGGILYVMHGFIKKEKIVHSG
jgi:uncharacterized protein (TIRG00374 family)